MIKQYTLNTEKCSFICVSFIHNICFKPQVVFVCDRFVTVFKEFTFKLLNGGGGGRTWKKTIVTSVDTS